MPIPISPNELGLLMPLHEYVLKDRHVATITPKNELVPNKYLEDEPLDVEAIQEALRKSRIKLIWVLSFQFSRLSFFCNTYLEMLLPPGLRGCSLILTKLTEEMTGILISDCCSNLFYRSVSTAQ